MHYVDVMCKGKDHNITFQFCKSESWNALFTLTQYFVKDLKLILCKPEVEDESQMDTFLASF